MLNSAKFRVIHSNILRPAKADSRRVSHHVATALISVNDVRFEAQIREASGYDIMVDFSRPLPELKPGQHLNVVFLTAIPTVEISIPGIVHWVSGETSSVAMGIMLASPVPPEFLACHPSCLRSSIRFQCKVRGEVHYTTVGTSSVASVLNYSRHGLCLQTRTLPPVGTKFRFIWNQPGQSSVEGLVRWVTGQGESLIAGCEIIGKSGYVLSGLPTSTLTFKETPLFD
ncbi:MAG: PilZ domain-containing protein [Planctomyces sp.]|nr:PilZ domain-containing protein [Planctomyces sp.]